MLNFYQYNIDSLKISCQNILEYQKKHNASILIITHHTKLLESLNVEYVHIIKEGRIIKSGDLLLAKEIEKKGFNDLNMTNIIRENHNYE